MSCISVGKVIKYLLENGLKTTNIKNKIYPLVADESTTYPFIVYRRNSINEESNKDYSSDSVIIQVLVITNTYQEGVHIAEDVRKALVHKKGNIQSISVEDVILQDGSEEFIDNAFVQNLTFKIILQ